jgi:hypothetical protein
MRLHQIEILLHSTGNNDQNEETTYRIGQNSCNLFKLIGLIYNIYKKLKN